MKFRPFFICLVPALLAFACTEDASETQPPSDTSAADTGDSSDTITASERPAIATDGAIAIAVVIPEDAGPATQQGARDLLDGFAAITGAEATDPATSAEGPQVRVRLAEDAPVGDEGYEITSGADSLEVLARTDVGAMYGLHHVARALGVRYLHPEQTFFPNAPEMRLPEIDVRLDPGFAMRGFHEHTQHPIVMSDVLLRPGRDDFRGWASNYVRWLARTGQNAMFFHLLKTLDREAWPPYMASIVAEAHDLGIKVGAVASFADQQQNNFKLIDDTGGDTSAQIIASLDWLMTAGLDYVEFQIGTSEFTKPTDVEVLGWLQTAVTHLTANYPAVKAWAWIHITCNLEADGGGRFFHLPLQGPAALGAFVHTTMFYTLSHPAPVYDCEDFSHQLDYLDAADGEQEMVFFPETAWWLGFDNNLPLAMPITGWSRESDIARVSQEWDVTGHVTFTTGREWGYWRYDHYLTRATWNPTLTFADYLDWMAPVFGDNGAALADTLDSWAQLQVNHIYEANPLIYFYLAGELPQDEAGAQAGVLARRPKRAFKDVLAFSDEEFSTWKTEEFDLLGTMLTAYEPLLAGLPAPETGQDLPTVLYREAHRTLAIYVQRLEHAIALYGAVIDIRNGDETAARTKLAAARAISDAVIATVKAASEDTYRYPAELLTEPKPDSLTSYPFGYVWETQTGFFWTRRDDQLESVIDDFFSAANEAWTAVPDAVWSVQGEQIALTDPDNPLASGVFGGFVPRMLFGVTGDAAALTVTVCQDSNGNDLPDTGSELAMTAAVSGGTWTAQPESYTIKVKDSAGSLLANLALLDPVFTFSIGDAQELTSGTLTARFESQILVQAVMAIAGIDQEGIENLIKDVFGVDASEPLPAELSVSFALTPEAVAGE